MITFQVSRLLVSSTRRAPALRNIPYRQHRCEVLQHGETCAYAVEIFANATFPETGTVHTWEASWTMLTIEMGKGQKAHIVPPEGDRTASDIAETAENTDAYIGSVGVLDDPSHEQAKSWIGS